MNTALKVDQQLPVWQQVAQRVRDYPLGVGRSAIATDFDVHVTTATAHLEKCVQRGALIKCYTWVKENSRGWVYYDPKCVTPRDLEIASGTNHGDLED